MVVVLRPSDTQPRSYGLAGPELPEVPAGRFWRMGGNSGGGAQMGITCSSGGLGSAYGPTTSMAMRCTTNRKRRGASLALMKA